ncbi:MAG TPA: Nif3-like dinuclear metal center hexameric protein [Solirubrobacterales bacterium]|nr:Nif3-like dinuclear metal center hexameric protein [Solirubrobacterales bacterium]
MAARPGPPEPTERWVRLDGIIGDPMASRDEIVRFCDELLDAGSWNDYGPNGLQVPGGAAVAKVATGVSAHLELLERAVASGAQLVLVHHGLFWNAHPRALSEQMAARLRVALDAGLSVAAYHLPLDAHPEIGNNALLCAGLGFEPGGSFGEVAGRPVGVVGRSEAGVEAAQLFRRVGELVAREPLVFDAGPERVRSIGIVSGGASSQVHDAVALGLDAFLTGEPAEHAMADAREGRVHFIAAGHYATETLGVRRLGELVAARFGVEHEFIDVPNPV